MLRLHYFMLLGLLLADGGTDGGTIDRSKTSGQDAGNLTPPLVPPRLDAGIGAPQPNAAGVIQWPENLPPLATLDGPAIIAANAALQHLLDRFAKEYPGGECETSAKAMKVLVGEQGGVYFVRIDQQVDKCGWIVPPGFTTEMDWFEMYAVSPDGRILARNPYHP